MNQPDNPVIILAIESSCDDTGAAVLAEDKILANVVAGQAVHAQYGGVVPELASRAHQQNILPVVDIALKKAGISLNDITAIAYTKGPGLLGSLLVGGSFAKGLSLSLNKPLLEVHHMQAHILAHFIDTPGIKKPGFPFLCLTVSGGHTQIVRAESPDNLIIIGETLDDAAGEAFDKVAKILELPYPGGPLVDKYARHGNPKAFSFPKPHIEGYNFSFSGFKTAFLNFINNNKSKDHAFVEHNLQDICASVQAKIVNILMEKLSAAARDTGIREIAIAGGVSANSGLRAALTEAGKKNAWNIYVPPFEYCTDNAAMIGIAGLFKYKKGDFAAINSAPSARYEFK